MKKKLQGVTNNNQRKNILQKEGNNWKIPMIIKSKEPRVRWKKWGREEGKTILAKVEEHLYPPMALNKSIMKSSSRPKCQPWIVKVDLGHFYSYCSLWFFASPHIQSIKTIMQCASRNISSLTMQLPKLMWWLLKLDVVIIH
jgi:hypothetical protein